MYKVYATSTGVGQFKLLSYDFWTPWEEKLNVTDLIVFDMTFVLVALNKKSLSVLEVDYSRFNDVYTIEDLKAIQDNESEIL